MGSGQYGVDGKASGNGHSSNLKPNIDGKAREEDLPARCCSNKTEMIMIISKSCSSKDSNKAYVKAGGKSNIKVSIKASKNATYEENATKKGRIKDDVVRECFDYKIKANTVIIQSGCATNSQTNCQTSIRTEKKIVARPMARTMHSDSVTALTAEKSQAGGVTNIEARRKASSKAAKEAGDKDGMPGKSASCKSRDHKG